MEPTSTETIILREIAEEIRGLRLAVERLAAGSGNRPAKTTVTVTTK